MGEGVAPLSVGDQPGVAVGAGTPQEPVSCALCCVVMCHVGAELP